MTRRIRYETDGPFVAEWFRRSIRFTDGHHGGQPFEFEPWQRDFIDEAFLIDPRTGHRVYQQAWLCMPKKNGKTQTGAGLALYGLAGDGDENGLELNPQVPIAAAARHQAAELGRTARIMALASPSLRRRLEINKHDVYATREGGGRLWWVASDADTIHGIKPSMSTR